MALNAGTRLGPYEILGAIGAGGMGEVYRARDTRLDREVAIKVLPASVADDPDRRARFEREAKAVAALSHPNILAIHDVGTDQSVFYAVTELLHGETLRERLTHGSLAPRKAIEIAIQIARALAAAHDRGLVHRDLKPENVFLLKDGHVKLLDFGLAKVVSREPAGSAVSTRTVELGTEPGAVLGTAGYMSPEQVRGQNVDARTDIFALGAVLYEMLSGRRAFKRDTAAETMTAILRDEPQDLTTDRPDVSPALDRIVRHCLEKSPDERFQSARDVAFALEALSGTGVSTSGAAVAAAVPPPAARRHRWPLVAAGGVVAGLAIGAFAGTRLFERTEAPPTFETKTWDAQWITNARFTRDGQTIVFSAARVGNAPGLFVIRPDSIVSQPLGPPNTELLAVSSQNELAVLTGAQALAHRVFVGTLGRMTLDGAERPVLEHVTEADWSPDGQSLAVLHYVNGRHQLEYPIGQKRYETAGYLSDARVSPDGARVAFFDHLLPGDNRGWVKVVDRGGRVTTLAGEYSGLEGLAWSPDGRSVVFSESETGGDYQPLTVGAAGGAAPRRAFSSAGSIIVLDHSASGRLLAIRYDQRHSIRGVPPGETVEHEYPWLDFVIGGGFSPDGRLLGFTDLSQTAGNDYAVSIRKTDGSPVVRLGPGAAFGFSPDVHWLGGFIPSKQQIVLYPTGPGTTATLERGPIETYGYVAQWLTDGRRLIVCGVDASKVARCYQQSIAGGPPTPITPEGFGYVLVASDDRTMLMRREAGTFVLGSIGSTDQRAVKGLADDDKLLAFSRDGRSVFAQVGSAVPSRVDRVDLATGARTMVKELVPPDRSGVTLVAVDQWLDDGRAYTYHYARMLSTLFVVHQ